MYFGSAGASLQACGRSMKATMLWYGADDAPPGRWRLAVRSGSTLRRQNIQMPPSHSATGRWTGVRLHAGPPCTSPPVLAVDGLRSVHAAWRGKPRPRGDPTGLAPNACACGRGAHGAPSMCARAVCTAPTCVGDFRQAQWVCATILRQPPLPLALRLGFEKLWAACPAACAPLEARLCRTQAPPGTSASCMRAA
jgi:hypothetical protein